MGAPVLPNGVRQRAWHPRDPGRTGTLGRAAQLLNGSVAGNHLNFAVNGAQGAPSAAAAISAACSAVGTLQGTAASSLRVLIGADYDALEPPRLARRACATFLGQPSHFDVPLKFCPAGQRREDSHGVAQLPSAQLYFYLKEGDLRWGDVSFFAGAPLSPRESAAACALLSVCCSTRRRTVLAMSLESAHDLGRSRYLELTIVTGM